MLVAAYQAAGKQTEAEHELDTVLPLIAQLDSQHPVVVVASQVSDLLQAIPVRDDAQADTHRRLLAAIETFQRQMP